MCYDTSGSDNAVVADGDAGTNCNRCAEPAIAADADGFGVAEAFRFSLCGQKRVSLAGDHRVKRRYDGYVGAEVAVISDSNLGVILNGQVKVAEKTLPDFCMAAVVKIDGSLEKGTFSELAEHFRKDSGALFCLVLVCCIVIDVQIVCLELQGPQFRVAWAEQNTGPDFIFLPHMKTSRR